MSKTGLSIESDVYKLVKNSVVKTTIKGKLYREGMRPKDAETEDAVVSFVAGLDGQIQTGVVILNLYVPDFVSSGSKVKDIERCTELESLVDSFVKSLSVTGSYRFELDKTVQTFKAEGISQHFVNCRIKFELCNL